MLFMQKFDEIQLWQQMTVNIGFPKGTRMLDKLQLLQSYGENVTDSHTKAVPQTWPNIICAVTERLTQHHDLSEELYDFEHFWRSTKDDNTAYSKEEVKVLPIKANLQIIWTVFMDYVKKHALESKILGQTKSGSIDEFKKGFEEKFVGSNDYFGN